MRAGLAPQPGEYEWSSARAHLTGQDPSGVLDMEFWEREGGRERWESLLATPDELVAMRLLRRCTYAGRPYGDEEFLAELEQRFQRRWRRWSFEVEAPGQRAASAPA